MYGSEFSYCLFLDERGKHDKICNCDSNDFGSLPLFKTHSLTPIDEVERLLAKESALGRKDSNGNTLLHIAGKKMHWPLFKLLLERGSDLKEKNVCGFSPLDLYLKDQGIIDRAYIVKNHFDLTYQDAEEIFGDKNILLWRENRDVLHISIFVLRRRFDYYRGVVCQDNPD